MTNSFINIITWIILVMVRMVINDVRPAGVQGIVVQPTCPPLAPGAQTKPDHIANITLGPVWQGAGGDHPRGGPGAADQGGQGGVVTRLHPLWRHVPGVLRVLSGAL